MFKTRAIQVLACVLTLAAATALWGQRYTYDAGGRLVRVAYAEGGGVAYSYDEADNMTAVVPLALLPAPAAPEVTRLSPTEARVEWQGQAGATGYVIERRLAGGTEWTAVARVSGDTTVFIDTTLDPNEDYVYRIAVENEDGQSAYSPESQELTLTLPAPSISQNGVVNGASFEGGRAIAPGSIISIFGANIGVELTDEGLAGIRRSAREIPLPVALEDYSVLINGREAPLFFVGGNEVESLNSAAPSQTFAGQVNAQVPWEIEPGPANVVVRRETPEGPLESAAAEVNVAVISPALFTFDFGPGRAAAVNVKVRDGDGVTDGSFAQPAGSFQSAEPAPLGGVVTLFANGLGPVEPAAGTGNNSLDALRETTIPLRVLVGGAEAEVLFSGLSPQFVGVWQLNIVIPIGAPPGSAVPIQIVQGGLSSRDDVTIALRAPTAAAEPE